MLPSTWTRNIGIAVAALIGFGIITNIDNDKTDATERAKEAFAEMVIEYPDDMTLNVTQFSKIKDMSVSGMYNKYTLKGQLHYPGKVEDIDVIMHQNIGTKDPVWGEWVLFRCNTCPTRKEPKPDTSEWDKWTEIKKMIE